MKNRTRSRLILLVESFGFATIIWLAWANELAGQPHVLFAGHGFQNWREGAAESLVTLVLWVVVLAITQRVLRRVNSFEELIRTCGWCRRLNCAGPWTSFEDYCTKELNLDLVRETCPSCGRRSISDQGSADFKRGVQRYKAGSGTAVSIPSPHKTARTSLRVAIDARYIREKPSGIGVYVQALVERLPGQGPSDEFFFWAHPLAPDPLSPSVNTSAVVVWPGPNSPLPVFWPQHYAPFKDIDVFHSPHNMMPRGLPCPSVVTVHDVMAIERPRLHMQGIERIAKSGYYQQAVWRALRQATCLIAPTKATADRICALVPDAAARLTVIWEAPDPCFRPPEDLDKTQMRASELTGGTSPYLLVVGANAPTKRHAAAIEAFAATVPQPWRLVLLERRKGGKRLVSLARRLHIAHRTVWLNAVAREDVVTLIQAAGALVQPSIYEGFGLPVIEAMACGCPVVASDIAPFRELTAGAALLFPAYDIAALGKALRELVDSRALRSSLSAQGLERATEFSWNRCTKETLEVYRAAANRP